MTVRIIHPRYASAGTALAHPHGQNVHRGSCRPGLTVAARLHGTGDWNAFDEDYFARDNARGKHRGEGTLRCVRILWIFGMESVKSSCPVASLRIVISA